MITLYSKSKKIWQWIKKLAIRLAYLKLLYHVVSLLLRWLYKHSARLWGLNTEVVKRIDATDFAQFKKAALIEIKANTGLSIAQKLILRNNLDKLEQLWLQAEDYTITSPDLSIELRQLLGLQAESWQQPLLNGLLLYQLANLALRTPDQTTVALTHLHQAVALFKSSSTQAKQSAQLATAISPASNKSNNTRMILLAGILALLSEAYLKQNHYWRSRYYLHQSNQLLQVEVKRLDLEKNILRKNSRNPQKLKLAFLEAEPDNLKRISTLLGQANLYAQKEQTQEAFDTIQEVVALLPTITDQRLLAVQMVALSKCYHRLNLRRVALGCLDQALELYSQQLPLSTLEMARTQLLLKERGRLLIELGRLAEGLANWRVTLDLNAVGGQRLWRLKMEARIDRLHQNLGEEGYEETLVQSESIYQELKALLNHR
jgi:tetratricopeptide (TPR) repeat protein